MKALVADASVCAAWVLRDELSDQAEKLLNDVLRERVALLVPDLWLYEMANVLRSAVTRKRITPAQALEALELLDRVPVTLVAARDIPPAAMLATALRHELSAYDAAYLTLAELRGALLVTQDADLLALRQTFTWITAPADYRTP